MLKRLTYIVSVVIASNHDPDSLPTCSCCQSRP